jgi:DNA polymerase III subunit chi
VTQVDFYILESDSEDARLRLTCRLVDKATQQNQHVFINASSDVEAQTLDELLWTFSQGSFIPHTIVRHSTDAAPREPVVIGLNQAHAGERWDMLVNLAADVPEFFSRYQRVAENFLVATSALRKSSTATLRAVSRAANAIGSIATAAIRSILSRCDSHSVICPL